MKNRIYNKSGESNTKLFEVKNMDGDGPAEIYLYDGIGQDPWTGQGITAKMVADTLATIPKHKDLDMHINSAGGDVWEGMAIKSLLDAWPKAVNAIIDRKSTRLNSSHLGISYAVFCL